MHMLRLRPPRQFGAVPRVRDADPDGGRGSHMIRRLLSIAAVLPFVACSATVVISHWVPVGLHLYSSGHPWPHVEREMCVDRYESLDEPGPCDGPLVPSYDCGFIPGTIYFRRSVYVPTQIETPSGVVDVDDAPYQPFVRALPLRMRVSRVWQQGDTSLVIDAPTPLVLIILAVPPVWCLKRWLTRRTPGYCSLWGASGVNSVHMTFLAVYDVRS